MAGAVNPPAEGLECPLKESAARAFSARNMVCAQLLNLKCPLKHSLIM